ncbi:M15 family metallopeptidase [Xenorhabdus sp. PB61.4]|uniref:M15 family metallopeptidase n=1 Tax=Xenorhabdus sp. PB61.4 TaxID=2788940 RepID=UPI001E55EDE6|nr:M15 family metallopeptidase [Xenorhabdus sp. PB61.4]MCC8367561.1 M15 family metallopeptidase [Xenorhabdus sp. PB61.4]
MLHSFTDRKISTKKIFDWETINKISINECHEPLEVIYETDKIKLKPVYFLTGINGAVEYCAVRKSVAEKLIQASQLLPSHLGLLVLDGWRSRETQLALQEKTRATIAQQYSYLSVEEQKELLEQFVAPAPTEQNPVSPHLTGGSVDVTLFDIASGKALFMGTEFDEVDDLSYTAALEQSSDTNMPTVLYRRILHHVMIQAGFTNLPTEWWHYDYGNALWAFYKNDQAVYGAVEGIRESGSTI